MNTSLYHSTPGQYFSIVMQCSCSGTHETATSVPRSQRSLSSHTLSNGHSFFSLPNAKLCKVWVVNTEILSAALHGLLSLDLVQRSLKCSLYLTLGEGGEIVVVGGNILPITISLPSHKLITEKVHLPTTTLASQM